MGAEILLFVVKNWKAFAIGGLILALIGLGYYFKSVIADRDEARAKIIQLGKDLDLEKERARQLSAAIELKDADIKKYQSALTEIQDAHDELDREYTRLWKKYKAITTNVPIGDIAIPSTFNPKASGSDTKTSQDCPPVTCFKKSILTDLVILPAGRPTFKNLSSAMGGAK